MSKPNLAKVFKNKVVEHNEILLENTRPITEEYTKELTQLLWRLFKNDFFTEIVKDKQVRENWLVILIGYGIHWI